MSISFSAKSDFFGLNFEGIDGNIISLKEFFETFNFSIVQMLFHVERSTAVGIHPIKAIINKMLFLSLSTGLIKLSEISVGPFITQTINANKVLKSKIDDINLNNILCKIKSH